MPRFGEVLTAMATPFGADGALDLDGARALARWLQDHGSDGLVVAGSTGEASTLDDDERLSLIEAVAEAVTIPVLAGVGTADTAHSVRLAKAVRGAAGLLVVCPYYNRPSQDGIEAHFRAVAAATPLPVVLYDVPVRAGRKIATERLARLATEVPNVVGLKDAAGNPVETSLLAARAPGLEIWSGDDAMTLPLLAVGAIGVVAVASHWAGPELRELVRRFTAGDPAGARAIHQRLLPSFAFESTDEAPNPVPCKAMLAELGLPGGPCRAPMGPTPAGLRERAREVLAGLRG